MNLLAREHFFQINDLAQVVMRMFYDSRKVSVIGAVFRINKDIIQLIVRKVFNERGQFLSSFQSIGDHEFPLLFRINWWMIKAQFIVAF